MNDVSRREIMCDGETYQVYERDVAPVGYSEAALRGPAPKSEWALHFWGADGVDIGSVRNRTGLRIDDLTDEELCLRLAAVLDEGKG